MVAQNVAVIFVAKLQIYMTATLSFDFVEFSNSNMFEYSNKYYVMSVLKGCDLTTPQEKNEILLFYHRCISRLKPIDRKLPQVRG